MNGRGQRSKSYRQHIVAVAMLVPLVYTAGAAAADSKASEATTLEPDSQSAAAIYRLHGDTITTHQWYGIHMTLECDQPGAASKAPPHADNTCADPYKPGDHTSDGGGVRNKSDTSPHDD